MLYIRKQTKPDQTSDSHISLLSIMLSLEFTSTWAVATVCLALIAVGILAEHGFHHLAKCLQKRRRKSLSQALSRVESELMQLGFVSLLLTVAQQPISKICIPSRLGDSFLPCKDAPYSSNASATGSPCQEMKKWESWEEETRSLEYQVSHDSRRFKLRRQTSFGRRHLRFWSNHSLLRWPVCFLRQFIGSVSKADYFALRRGFMAAHLSKKSNFNFHKFLNRAMDEDLVMVVGTSVWVWTFAVLFIFFNARRFYNYFWLPFIPLVVLLAVGTKLEDAITIMCLESSEQSAVVVGSLLVQPKNDLFWFGRPQLVLHLIHFILFQNSFQLAFFAWTWYKFGWRSCFHRENVDIVLTIIIGILVQFLCGYVALPLYALVSQMGTFMRKAVFTERVVRGLKNWHKIANQNLAPKASGSRNQAARPSSHSVHNVFSTVPSPSCTINTPVSDAHEASSLELVCTRRGTEHVVGEIVEEEITPATSNRLAYDGEISFEWMKERRN
ncbi:MLO-like protein 12 isoform X2 [Elaeis guineensis]|uniref:MLO-like protein n=1 Tax=Elaeis guineensis var. tenera TaxID=51953 RepID=A0A8N4EZH9_ELAGV|nr:MLO-like protein 12 isoform X2 [Elaeis guineensis]